MGKANQSPADGEQSPHLTPEEFREKVLRPNYYLKGSLLQEADPVVQLPKDVLECLPTVMLAASNLHEAQRFWDLGLSDREHGRLGGDFLQTLEMYRSPVYMLMVVRPYWLYTAIIHVAEVLEVFRPSQIKYLRRKVRQADPVIAQLAGPAPAATEDDDDEDYDSKAMEAIETHDLVMIRGGHTRLIYWKGDEIDADWHVRQKPWEFISMLIEKAKEGQRATRDDFGNMSKTIIANWRYQIQKLVPNDLAALISPHGDGDYELPVPSARIAIVDLPAHARLYFREAEHFRRQKELDNRPNPEPEEKRTKKRTSNRRQ